MTKFSIYIKYEDQKNNTRVSYTVDNLEATGGNVIPLESVFSKTTDGKVFIPTELAATTTVRYVVTDSAGRKIKTYKDTDGKWKFTLPQLVFPEDVSATDKAQYVPGPLTVRVKYVPLVAIWYYKKVGNTYTKDTAPVYTEPWSVYTLSKSGATAYAPMGTPITVDETTEASSIKVRNAPVKVAYETGTTVVPEPKPEPTPTPVPNPNTDPNTDPDADPTE